MYVTSAFNVCAIITIHVRYCKKSKYHTIKATYKFYIEFTKCPKIDIDLAIVVDLV